MKKILLGFMIAGLTLASAQNTAKFFKKGASQSGGMFDNEVIFIYDKKDNKKDMTSQDSLDLLKNISKVKICQTKDTRSIITDAGMNVKFIYETKEGYTIIKIDDCKGIDIK